MSTIFVADVLAVPEKGADRRKLYETFGLEELSERARSDDTVAVREIEKRLKEKYFSMRAWRVHKIEEDTRMNTRRPRGATTTEARLIQTTTDRIIKDFGSDGAQEWRNHDYRAQPTQPATKPRRSKSKSKAA